jgi:hypothetical protein
LALARDALEVHNCRSALGRAVVTADTRGVKPPPESLPRANSSKWHSRRSWDSLGYIRVRTLANPKWTRDPEWLLRILQFERPRSPGEQRDSMDAAIAATKRYRAIRQRRGETDAEFAVRTERLFDEILAPLDDLLGQRQREHLRSVREAGASGPRCPTGSA